MARRHGPESRHAVLPSRLGDLTVVADGDAVTGIYFGEHWTLPDPATFGPCVEAGDEPFAAVGTQFADFLDGRRTRFDLACRATGTPFEQDIWTRLTEIPYGETTTYGAIATALGNPRLAQEVGRVVGANPLSVVVPCHRVVGADGSLTGYAGGLGRKQYLLDLEAYLTGQTLLDPREAAG